MTRIFIPAAACPPQRPLLPVWKGAWVDDPAVRSFSLTDAHLQAAYQRFVQNDEYVSVTRDGVQEKVDFSDIDAISATEVQKGQIVLARLCQALHDDGPGPFLLHHNALDLICLMVITPEREGGSDTLSSLHENEVRQTLLDTVHEGPGLRPASRGRAWNFVVRGTEVLVHQTIQWDVVAGEGATVQGETRTAWSDIRVSFRNREQATTGSRQSSWALVAQIDFCHLQADDPGLHQQLRYRESNLWDRICCLLAELFQRAGMYVRWVRTTECTDWFESRPRAVGPAAAGAIGDSLVSADEPAGMQAARSLSALARWKKPMLFAVPRQSSNDTNDTSDYYPWYSHPVWRVEDVRRTPRVLRSLEKALSTKNLVSIKDYLESLGGRNKTFPKLGFLMDNRSVVRSQLASFVVSQVVTYPSEGGVLIGHNKFSRRAVELLKEAGFSASDIADLLRISHNRLVCGLPITWGEDLRCLDLREVDMSGERSNGKTLVGADLRGANLSNADLRGSVQLGNTEWDRTPIMVSRLAGANLGGADLRASNLSECDLSGMDLRGANFSHADLSGAKLDGAKLDEAKLQGANLSGASLVGVDLTNVDLSATTLDGVTLDRRPVGLRATLAATQLPKLLYSGTDLANVTIEGEIRLSEDDLWDALAVPESRDAVVLNHRNNDGYGLLKSIHSLEKCPELRVSLMRQVIGAIMAAKRSLGLDVTDIAPALGDIVFRDTKYLENSGDLSEQLLEMLLNRSQSNIMDVLLHPSCALALALYARVRLDQQGPSFATSHSMAIYQLLRSIETAHEKTPELEQAGLELRKAYEECLPKTLLEDFTPYREVMDDKNMFALLSDGVPVGEPERSLYMTHTYFANRVLGLRDDGEHCEWANIASSTREFEGDIWTWRRDTTRDGPALQRFPLVYAAFSREKSSECSTRYLNALQLGPDRPLFERAQGAVKWNEDEGKSPDAHLRMSRAFVELLDGARFPENRVSDAHLQGILVAFEPVLCLLGQDSRIRKRGEAYLMLCLAALITCYSSSTIFGTEDDSPEGLRRYADALIWQARVIDAEIGENFAEFNGSLMKNNCTDQIFRFGMKPLLDVLGIEYPEMKIIYVSVVPAMWR